MPSKIAVHKPAEPQAGTRKSSAQVPLADKAALKPQLRTPLELKQLTNRLLTAPETVTSGEFTMLTSAIGLRSALMLLDQGKRNKGKAEPGGTAPDITPKESRNPSAASPAVPEKAAETRPKAETNNRNTLGLKKAAEGKPLPLTEKQAPARAIHATRKTSQLEAGQQRKSEEKPAIVKAEAKSERKAEPAVNAQLEVESKPQAKVRSGAKPDKKSAAIPAAPGQRSAATGPLTAGQPVQASKAPAKAPAKAPVVHIKGDNPGSVIQQLGSIAPAEITQAYTQAAGVSGEALGQQRQ